MNDNNNRDDIYRIPDNQEIGTNAGEQNYINKKVNLFIHALAFRLTGELGWDSSLSPVPVGKYNPEGVFFSSERVIFAVDASNPENLNVQDQVDYWFEKIQNKELPPQWNNIILLFIFPDDVPDGLRNQIPNIKKMKSLGVSGVYTALADLKYGNLQLTLDHKIEPFTQSIKNALTDYLKGNAPENTGELKKDLDDLYEKTLEFESKLAKTTPVATYTLLGLCVAIFIWMSTSGGSTNIANLLRFGASYKPLFEAGEWWRVISPIFLHIGIFHLFMNMYILLDVGSKIEQFFGNVKYLALFFVSGITGALLSVSLGSSVSAGASGAIFGICGAAAWIGYRYKDEIPAPSRNRLAGGMMVFIAYNLLFGFSIKGVDNAAHIGGLLAGLVFAILIPSAVQEKKDWSKILPVKALIYLLAFLPFMVEGYALYRAVTCTTFFSYPKTHYHQSDISFDMPAVFKTQNDDKSTLFIGPGLVVEFVTGSTKGELDIESWDEQKLKEIKNLDNLKVSGSRFEEINGRKWVVLDGTTEFNQNKSVTSLKTRVYLSTSGGIFYRFTGGTPDKDFSNVSDSLQIMVSTLKDSKKK